MSTAPHGLSARLPFWNGEYEPSPIEGQWSHGFSRRGRGSGRSDRRALIVSRRRTAVMPGGSVQLQRIGPGGQLATRLRGGRTATAAGRCVTSRNGKPASERNRRPRYSAKLTVLWQYSPALFPTTGQCPRGASTIRGGKRTIDINLHGPFFNPGWPARPDSEHYEESQRQRYLGTIVVQHRLVLIAF